MATASNFIKGDTSSSPTLGDAMADTCVLIAVRSPLISDALQSVLELNHFTVAGTVSTSREAVTQAELLRPEIILLDSKLLFGRGEEVVHSLLAAHSEAKVVMLADGTEDGEARAAISWGAAGLIHKGASASIILSTLRRIAPGNGQATTAVRDKTDLATKNVGAVRDKIDLATKNVGAVRDKIDLSTKNVGAVREPPLPGSRLSSTIENRSSGEVAFSTPSEVPTSADSSLARSVFGMLANLVSIAVCLAAVAPLARTYLTTYPPPGLDFIHGMSNITFLRQHPGLWVSLWNSSWFAGDPFARTYGVLSSYMGLPFALLLGDGPGLLTFLISTQFVFVLFTYLLLKELSGRYLVAVCLTVLVAWSANVYIMLFLKGFTAQASAQMFLPICLFVLAKYLRTRNPRLLAATALLNGLAFLTHPIVGSLIGAVVGVILFCAGDATGRLLSGLNIRRVMLYGSLAALVGGVVGVPLITNILFAFRVAAAVAAGASAEDYYEPRAPIDMLLTTNPALLALILGVIGWGVYRNRRKLSRKPWSKELFALAAAMAILEAIQVAFALGMNPSALFLKGWRTWWIAPVLLAGIVAVAYKEFSSGADFDGEENRIETNQLAARMRLVFSTGLLAAAVIGPWVAWPQIASSIERTRLGPPVVIDALMRPEELANKPVVPPWLDVDRTDVRAWIQNPGITMWWSVLYPMPMTGGYYDPAYRPWVDWRNWMQMAINGTLGSQPGYTLEASKNVAKFLIDWFAIRYFIASTGTTYNEVAAASFLLAPDIVEDSAFINGLETIAVKPELSDPIVSATNTPTVLVIGDDSAYDTIIRAISLANLGSRKVITIRGPQRIDDISAEEISRFDAVMLYNYDYSDAGRAFGIFDDYVRRGGGLVIDTGSVVRDSESANLPSPFPLVRVKRGPLGTQWTLTGSKSKAFGEVDGSKFSPPRYGNGPWALSYGPDASDVKPWAEMVLGQVGSPIMVAGELGKGRVVWSGMNLPYHVVSYVNLSEAALLADVIRWVAPQGAGAAPEYRVQRPSPESVTLTGSRFKGVLFKENGLGGWGAKVLKGQSTTDVKIYRAGPDFMYVGIPANDRADQVAVQFSYVGQGQDWVLLWISLITVLLTVDYALFDGAIAVRRLAMVMGPLAQSTRRLSETVSRGAANDEEEV